MSVSAVVLNFNRPGYLWQTIRPQLMGMDEIDELVISNGKRETDLTMEKIIKYRNKRGVKQLQHWGDMNSMYGLTLRFLSALEAGNEYVLIMDDDIIPTRETVKFLLKRVKENPDVIHGLYGRSFDEKGEYSYENLFGEVPVVLTRCMMTTREKCKYFMDNFRLYESELIKNSKPYWNGEDVLFSLLSFQKTGKMNHAYDLSHTNRVWNYLNLSESISVGDDHNLYRKKLSKQLLENMGLKDEIKQKEKVLKKKYQLSYFIENTYIPRYLMLGFCGGLFN